MDTNKERERSSLRGTTKRRRHLTTAKYVLLEARIMELEGLLDEVATIFDSIPIEEMKLGHAWMPSNELLILMSLAKDSIYSNREHR